MGLGDMQDSQKVVHLCQDGQLDAFATLFSHYQYRIYDLACTILRDDVAAEDVVQDTFLAIFQKIDGFKGESAFETWLTAIAVNQCRKRLRKRRVRQFLSLEQLTPRRLFRASDREENVADIVKGLFFSVIKRMMEMDSLTERVVMTGGVVAHNPFLVTMVQETIGREVLVPQFPQLTGALGAALFALDGN